MTIFESLILGAVQGLTEFIPVSSSGHLVVGQYWLGLQVSHAFDVAVNFGTFLALIIYFRRRIIDIARRIVIEKDYRLGRNIVISAIPVGIIGYFFDSFLAGPFFTSPLTVAFMLLLVGIIMIIVDKVPHLSALSKSEELSPKRAGFIGVAQVLALIPGTSRSGATMVAGRLAGLTYKEAAEYSFLLSIPVMAAVTFKSFISDDGQAFIRDQFYVWMVSNAAALVFGLIAVGFMLRFLSTGNFKIFGYYRIGLSAIILVSLLFAH